MSRYAHRPRRERIALEADDFIQAIRRGEVEVGDTYDYGPELRQQEAIASALGIGRTQADADRVRALLFDGIDTGYGVATGAQLQGRGRLGIDGDYRSDSEIRLHRNDINEVDPLLDESVNYRGITDGYNGIESEYLTPGAAQALFREWAPSQRPKQRTPDHFNRAIAEYYGQQALKLAGNTPVSDADRSYNIRRDSGRNRNTTLGTDRLIETNRSMIGGDVGMPAADYRYNTPAGDIRVGDMQVALYDSNPGEAGVRLQALKGSKMTPAQERRFAGNLIAAARESGNIDEALWRMHQRGELPPLSREEIKRHQRDKPNGMRAGKMTSDAWFMGGENFNDQHRYQHVLYALQKERPQTETLGAVPRGYVDVDTAAARVFMNDNAERLKLMATIGSRDGSAILHSNVDELIKAGVATDLISKHPAIAQLLPR